MNPAAAPPAPSRWGRLLRWSLLIVPIGVAANLALSWFATDHAVLRAAAVRPRAWLFIAVALALVPWLTNSLRILIWARFLGYPLRLRDTLRIIVSAELTSSLLPTSTGSEVVRLGLLVRSGLSAGQAASVVTLGYLEDLIFFLLALPAAFFVSAAWRLPVLRALAERARLDVVWVPLVVLGGILILRVAWQLAVLGRFGAGTRRATLRGTARAGRRARQTGREFRAVYRLVARRGKLRFVAAWFVTVVQWSCRYSVATALAYFLGFRVDPVLFFLLQWVIFTAMLFIPTPGAAGGAEGLFLLVYSALLPAGAVGLVTAGWRLLTFYLPLSLGALLLGSSTLKGLAEGQRNRHKAPRPV